MAIPENAGDIPLCSYREMAVFYNKGVNVLSVVTVHKGVSMMYNLYLKLYHYMHTF